MWQMGGPGPMLGQVHHFVKYNKGKAPYAEERYLKEAHRLYRRARHAGLTAANSSPIDYSIADIAIWPWISRFEWQTIDLKQYPNVKRWYETIAVRACGSEGLQGAEGHGSRADAAQVLQPRSTRDASALAPSRVNFLPDWASMRSTMASRPKQAAPRPAPRPLSRYAATCGAFRVHSAIDRRASTPATSRQCCCSLADADERTLINCAKALAPPVQGKDAALLLDGRPNLVARAGADGAHLTGLSAFTNAVGDLKPERIVGAGGLVTPTRCDARR